MNKKRDVIMLVVLAVLFIFIQYELKPRGIKVKSEYYAEMKTAAQKMKYMEEEVKVERLKRGIPIERELDKNETGLVGTEWSGITTTLGSLESKRTSCDPDFAALMVKVFREAGLEKGDRVAANLSSSFPALNLAFIAAADTIGLEAIIVTSAGASTYGGNIEEFTYLDMENYLYSKGVIENRSSGWSFGGLDDVGREFEPEIKEKLVAKNSSYKLKFFYEENIKKNLEQRYAYYQQGGEIKAFVNIGGNLLSIAGSVDIISNQKVLLNKNINMKNGLVGLFLKDDVPVFYLLNLKSITSYYGMKFDPDGFAEVGTSAIYFEKSRNIWNWVIILLFVIFVAQQVFVSRTKKV